MTGTFRVSAIAAVVLAGLAAAAAAPARRAAACKPHFENGVEYLCGPATAALRTSNLSRVRFRHGSCRRERVAGERHFIVEIGALEPGSRRNGGRDYIKIEVVGPLSHPNSGYVIAYHKGRRWSGTGTSF